VKLTIAALGRLKAGPERELVVDYLRRASQTGRPLGLGPAGEVEIDNRSLKTKSAESRALSQALPEGARIILLDERGKTLTSPQLARQLAAWRDEGVRETVFCIGGADGHDRDALPKPHLTLSLGNLVWPHMLVRVMIAEQIYRAASILSGSPYHRD